MEAATMTREETVTITVYSKPGCVQCNAVKKKLTKEGLIEGVDFTVIDVSLPEHAGDLEALKALGYGGVPVTFVNDHHFKDYDVNEIADAVARQRRTALHVVEATAA